MHTCVRATRKNKHVRLTAFLFPLLAVFMMIAMFLFGVMGLLEANDVNLMLDTGKRRGCSEKCSTELAPRPFFASPRAQAHVSSSCHSRKWRHSRDSSFSSPPQWQAPLSPFVVLVLPKMTSIVEVCSLLSIGLLSYRLLFLKLFVFSSLIPLAVSQSTKACLWLSTTIISSSKWYSISIRTVSITRWTIQTIGYHGTVGITRNASTTTSLET